MFIPSDGQQHGKKESILVQAYPPRPSFVQDMTEFERKVMQEHATYWNGLIDDGIAIVFGLVLDPRGAWGVGIFDVANESDARDVGANDPAVKTGGLTFEVYPMPSVEM